MGRASKVIPRATLIEHDELAIIGEHESIELSNISKIVEPKPRNSETENAFTFYRKELLFNLKDPSDQLSPAL